MRVPDSPQQLGMPYSSWWDHQRKALQDILDSKSKNIFLVAPTGSGKSAIAVALMRILQAQKSFLLTKTVQLQTQYQGDFPTMTISKGKRNYNCVITNQAHHTVDQAICQSGWSCRLKATCPYFVDLQRASIAKEVVFNYAMWLASSQYVGMFKNCNIMIADEGHELEKEVVKFANIHLRKKSFERWGITLPGAIDIKTYAEWATGMVGQLANAKTHLETELFDNMQGEQMTPLDEENARALRQVDTLLKTVRQITKAPDEGNWFIQPWKNGDIDMVPVWASKHAKAIFAAADMKTIVMSATLLPTDKTAHRMGVDSDFEFINVPSTFDASRSPIVFNPVASLKKSNLEEKLPDLLVAMDQILDDHVPEQQGLIHTSNYFIRDYMMANSRHRDLMVTHDSRNRETVITAFMKRKGLPILISPSIGTGFDGKQDIARFQIILKYPWPDLGDGLVRKRMEEDPESYDYDANSAFIQTCGRIMREYSDTGITYVLDGQLERMLKRRPSHFPDWVKERLV